MLGRLILLFVLTWSAVSVAAALPLAARAAVALDARPSVAPLMSLQTILPADRPRARGQRTPHKLVARFHSGHPDAVWVRLKASAASNPLAPFGTATRSFSAAPTAPSFAGMSDSASICPYSGGCQPPDGSVAASPSYVFEGVNTSFAVYQTNGTLVSGWPKTAQAFFNIPSPGSCDPSGVYTSNPRAHYDVADGRFWVAILQVQGPAIGDLCVPLSRYWIAVSSTSDPTQSWHVYSFNMDPSNTGNFADFTQIGFSHAAACFSGNMLNGSDRFQYAELYCASKPTMNSGNAVKAYGFSALSYNGADLDTIEPVDELTSATGGPGGEFFVSTFNVNFGGGSCAQTCNGGVLWLMSNAGQSKQTISGLTFSTTSNYSLPPEADEPRCAGCLQTDDVRIGGTPLYRAGSIYFAINSAINNGSGVVPGFLWQQLNPTVTAGGAISSIMLYQGAGGYLTGFGTDQAGIYPELVTDSSNNMILVLDTSSASLYPSMGYMYRHVLDSAGSMNSYQIVQKGVASSPDYLWGDYNGASWDGLDNLWVEGAFAPSSADWGTWITTLNIAAPIL